MGSAEWLAFFRLASDVFADGELGSKLTPDVLRRRDRLIESSKNLGVLDKLQSYAVSIKYINDRKEQGAFYYILILDEVTSRIQVQRFGDFTRASITYANYEKEFLEKKGKDVVLVSTESLKGLKLAYPNYFADTTVFRERVRKIIALQSQTEKKA